MYDIHDHGDPGVLKPITWFCATVDPITGYSTVPRKLTRSLRLPDIGTFMADHVANLQSITEYIGACRLNTLPKVFTGSHTRPCPSEGTHDHSDFEDGHDMWAAVARRSKVDEGSIEVKLLTVCVLPIYGAQPKRHGNLRERHG